MDTVVNVHLIVEEAEVSGALKGFVQGHKTSRWQTCSFSCSCELLWCQLQIYVTKTQSTKYKEVGHADHCVSQGGAPDQRAVLSVTQMADYLTPSAENTAFSLEFHCPFFQQDNLYYITI